MIKKITDIKNNFEMPKVDDIIEGKVIGKGKAAIYLDLGIIGTGIVYGREFYEAKEKIKNLDNGSKAFLKIVGLENEEGYIELSLSQAKKDLSWDSLKEKRVEGEVFSVKITGANKGGLLSEVMGIPAFLPVSQLSVNNYPKVEGGDNQKILKALQKFIGKSMEVKIFDLDPKEDKLILSEKLKEAEKTKEFLEKYKAGDTVEGEITGIVDFGAFVKFGEEDLEGLIHISELDWQLIDDPSQVIEVGEKVKLKIIDIDKEKVSLSLKALKKDPWEGIEKKFKKGDTIEGSITKFNIFGAFVQISPKIQGLCHISGFGSQKKMEENIELGKKYKFQILSLEPKDHRMSLKLIKK